MRRWWCRRGQAGGPGAPVTLRLANTGGSIDQTPAVEYFVKRVDELSDGNVRIEVVDQWAEFASDAEQQVVRGVSRGEIDLSWVGTRVFDTIGFENFEALTAPMLIDSYALEEAVIESGVTEEMMQGLDRLGVVGLGVLADGLRRPIGVTEPLLGPADWRGITFGTLRSDGQVEAIRALGATPAQIFGSSARKPSARARSRDSNSACGCSAVPRSGRPSLPTRPATWLSGRRWTSCSQTRPVSKR